MKFKKLVAALSAVTMLGSLAVAVPANAEETVAVKSLKTVTVKNDAKWYKVGNNDVDCSNDITSLGGNKFSFAAPDKQVYKTSTFITLPGAIAEQSNISVSMDVDLSSATEIDTTQGVYFKAASNSFTSSKFTKQTKGTITQSGTTISSLSSSNSPDKSTEGAENTLGIELAVFIRNVKGSVSFGPISVSYETEEQLDPSQAGAKIEGNYYKTVADAVHFAKDNDTITILKNAKLSGRLTIDKAVTITKSGDSNPTITVEKEGNNGDILIKKDVTIDGVNVQTDTQLKIDADNVSLTVKNANVTGGILLGKLDGTLNLDNTTVDKVTTRQGDPSGINGSNSVKGTGTIDELFYNSEADTIDSDTLAIKKMTDKSTSTSQQYFTFTGDSGTSYENVVVNVSGRPDDKTEGKATLGTAITGAGTLLLEITDIPNNVTINSITLE